MIKATAKLELNITVSGEDSDAKKFLDAAVISDSNLRSAIDVLVKELKSKAIWEQLQVLYPIIGGDATKHSLNLINANTFPITWVNSPTHSATGVAYNGVDQYGDTGFKMPHQDGHMGVYIRDNILNSNFDDMGATDDAVIFNSLNSGRTVFNSFLGGIASSRLSIGIGLISDTRGFAVLTKTPESVDLTGYKNGIAIGSGTPSTGAKILANMWLGGVNNNGVLLRPTGREAAFYTIGDSLTASNMLDYYNAIQTYQTSLGRNV